MFIDSNYVPSLKNDVEILWWISKIIPGFDNFKIIWWISTIAPGFDSWCLDIYVIRPMSK